MILWLIFLVYTLWAVARMPEPIRELLIYFKCHTMHKLELTSPIFIFEHNGVRRREVLTDVLPTWEQNG